MPLLNTAALGRKFLIRELERARESGDATDVPETGVDRTDYAALTQQVPQFVTDNSAHVARVVDSMTKD